MNHKSSWVIKLFEEDYLTVLEVLPKYSWSFAQKLLLLWRRVCIIWSWRSGCPLNRIQVREELVLNIWNRNLYKISHFQWTVRIKFKVCYIFMSAVYTMLHNGLTIYRYTDFSDLSCELFSVSLFSRPKLPSNELLGICWQVKHQLEFEFVWFSRDHHG